MASDDLIRCQGVVIESLKSARFRVQIEMPAIEVIATLAGKMRQRQVFVTPGDVVTVDVSAYDTSQGRIVYRVSPARRH